MRTASLRPPRRRRPTATLRLRDAVLVVSASVWIASATASAQETTTTIATPPTTAPATTLPPTSAPPTTFGGGSPTTTTASATTTTLPPGVVDEVLEGTPEDYHAQLPFDPAIEAVLHVELRKAKAAHAAAQARLDAADTGVGRIERRFVEIDRRVAELRERWDELGQRSSAARREFHAAVAAAYVRGNDTENLLVFETTDANEYGTRAQMMSTVVAHDQARMNAFLRERDEVGDELRDLLALRGHVRQEHARLAGFRHRAALTVGQAQFLAATFEAGGRFARYGWVFPVDGPVFFVDAFGDPRMVGTPYEHWHEGTDLMAEAGTPLVATEDGVVSELGSDVLGGIRVFLQGVSGAEYYYAHLSGYAPGIAVGKEVEAGDVLGYVGTTGNARGGSPHCHFEIHIDGRPINPYPILAVAYEWRQAYELLSGVDPLDVDLGPGPEGIAGPGGVSGVTWPPTTVAAPPAAPASPGPPPPPPPPPPSPSRAAS